MIIKAKKHFNSIIMKTTVAFVALVAVCCITAYSQNLFAEVGVADFASTAYRVDSSAEYCYAGVFPLNLLGEAVKPKSVIRNFALHNVQISIRSL